jgi:hypothetical protein
MCKNLQGVPAMNNEEEARVATMLVDVSTTKGKKRKVKFCDIPWSSKMPIYVFLMSQD